jgi:hypothetical protein
LAGLAFLCASLALAAQADLEPLFEGGISFQLPEQASALLVDDFDLDGRFDLAAVTKNGVVILPGAPAGQFGASRRYAAGLTPISMVSGDLNNDHSLDLVVANIGSGTLSVLLNQGDGTFATLPEQRSGLSPRTLALADFNGDGALDAVTSDLVAERVYLHLGDGTGKLKEALPFQVGDNPHTLVAGDFDGDGVQDLVVAQSLGVNRFRGLGNGSFEPPGLTEISSGARILSKGDINGDGKLDLALLTEAQRVLYLPNLGGGAFSVTEVDRIEAQGALRGDISAGLAVVDFDSNKLPDILASAGQRGTSALFVSKSLGDGRFRNEPPIQLDIAAAGLATKDLDQDGLIDLIASRLDAAEGVFFPGTSPGRLSARQVIPLSGSPRDLLKVDLNRDGLEDLVALDSTLLFFVKRDEPGGFADPLLERIGGHAFQAMAAADLDGDGKEELAVTDLVGDKVRVVFLDDGGSVTRSSEHLLQGSTPWQLAASDFDRDGLLDLAVADQGSPEFAMIFHPGSQDQVELVKVPVGSSQRSIAAADVDLDGAADIVVSTPEGGRLLLGDGSRRFPRAVEVPGLTNALALRIADIDQDHLLDVAAAFVSKVMIFGAVASAGGSRSLEVNVGPEARALEVFDVDSDGRLDLLAAGRNALLVRRGAAGGNFSPTEPYTVSPSPSAIVLGDFDGDSRLDAATADMESQSLSILHGRSPGDRRPFRRGDADGNGRAEITDAVAMLDSLFRGSGPLPCPDAADANDDGAVNLTDAVYLLLHLFAGGAPPPPPGPKECGKDPTADPLGPCAGC